jgi:hypothetical protein
MYIYSIIIHRYVNLYVYLLFLPCHAFDGEPLGQHRLGDAGWFGVLYDSGPVRPRVSAGVGHLFRLRPRGLSGIRAHILPW